MAKKSKKKPQVTKSRPTAYVITGIHSDVSRNQAQQILDQHGAALHNHKVILAGAAGIPYDGLKAELTSNEIEVVAVTDVHSIELLPGLNQSLNGATIDKGKVYIPDFANSRNRRTLPQLIGKFFSKVLGLVEEDGADSGIVVFDVSELDSRPLFSNHKAMDNSRYRLANWLTLNGLAQECIELKQVKAEQIKYSYFKNITNSVASRFDWFFTNPIKDFKSFNLRNFKQGNHSTYRFIFFALCLISFVLLPVLSFDYGATWDEPEDRNYFQEVIAYFQTGGEDERCLDTDRKLHDHLVNYGPFVNLACAFAEEYLSPFDTYETRHVVLSLFAFIGLLFTGLLARKAGTWRTGVVVMVLVLLTPVFWGHSANNQKDMPFMAFYIASLFYIVRMVRELPRVRTKTLVMTGLMLGILFSIRVGGLIAFGYLGLFAGLKFLFTMGKKDMAPGKRFMRYLTRGVLVLGIAYFLGVIFWPAALADPINHPMEALKSFEKFDLVHIYEIFEGERYYMKDFPWYYGPKLMMITLPLFILAGLVFLIPGAFKNWKKYKGFIVLILIFSAVFPMVYIIIKDSALYNSWRHVLFLFPSIAILAGIGWDYLLGAKQRIISLAAVILLVVSLGLTGTWMIKNHPYEYMYYNEIVGGVEGAYGNYELDYWCQTPRAGLKWILENEDLSGYDDRVVIVSNNEPLSLQYYADAYQDQGDLIRKNFRIVEELNDDIDQLKYFKKIGKVDEQEYNTSLDLLNEEKKPYTTVIDSLRQVRILWSREQQWNNKHWDYAIWTMRTLSPTQLEKGYFPPKGTIHTIDVDGVPVAAIVKREHQNIATANELITQRKYAEAEKLLLEYIEYDSLEEEAYRTMGYVRLVQGDFDGVIDWCNKAIKILPEGYFAHNFMGVAYLQKYANRKPDPSFLDSARDHLTKAIHFKPNFSSAHDGLGDVAYVQRNFPLAIKKYKEALSFTGNNARIYFKLGECYMELKDIQNAADNYNKSTQTNPNYAPPYQKLYRILVDAGQAERAQQYLDKYRQLTGQ